MPLPTSENLKAKISKENPSHSQRLENLKASLRSPYKLETGANSRSHGNNKEYYDRKAYFRKFEVNDGIFIQPCNQTGFVQKVL